MGAELRFNLMAIIPSKLQEANSSIDRNKYLRQRAKISLVSRGVDVELNDEIDDDEAPTDIPTFEELETREVQDLEQLVAKCTSDIEEEGKVVEKEKLKREKW